METKTYTVIGYRELEDMIEDHLGILTRHPVHYNPNDKRERFSVVADMEWNNDSMYDLGNFIGWMDEEDEYNPRTHLYVRDLQQKGIIPTDHHILIKVSW